MQTIIHYSHSSKTLRKERRVRMIKSFVEQLDAIGACFLGGVLVVEVYTIVKILV